MPEHLANWKLVLAYDGSGFHGWQIQPHHATIQGELQAAIARVAGETVLPQGSGRTDTGVHALAQVASFTLRAPIPEANLVRALNRTLPAAIRVLHAARVAPSFHARHSACDKTYEYRIYRGEICPPSLARYCLALNWPLALAPMQHAASLVCGRHDFTSFAATDPDLAQRISTSITSGSSNADPPHSISPISPAQDSDPDHHRTVLHSAWTMRDTELLVYTIRGTGFLHHMVRNLVGTFLAVGRGRLAPEQIPNILAARNRSSAGPTAPARGLFLVSVTYPNDAGAYPDDAGRDATLKPHPWQEP